MIVVPLIVASIIMGVRNMAARENFGRVGGKTVGFYVATGLIAVVTGLVLVNVINPGRRRSGDRTCAPTMPDVSEQLANVEGQGRRRYRRRHLPRGSRRTSLRPP